MPFLSVSLCNFRNISNSTIDLLSKEVYFVGENGQGKSNLLESLYYSAYGSSFRTRVDSEVINENEDVCKIRSIYKDDKEKTHTISLFLEDGKKKIEKNAKIINDRKELVDTIPCILFNHDDLDFVIGNPERKRFFIDQSLSMYETSYIDIFRKYKKIVKSRNNILKSRNFELLDAIDYQLAKSGLDIINRRTKTIFSFNSVFSKLFEEVCGIDNVKIEYTASWKKSTIDEVLIHLSEKRSHDIELNTTLSGPHRDRIRFIRNHTSYIPTASTGQRRLLSLLLRTAQATYYTNITGKLPVLLMDDVLLELDPEKRQKFMAVLPKYDQLFCTFLTGEPYKAYKKTSTKVYTVKNGCVYGE